jgi:hypothetical protein
MKKKIIKIKIYKKKLKIVYLRVLSRIIPRVNFKDIIL